MEIRFSTLIIFYLIISSSTVKSERLKYYVDPTASFSSEKEINHSNNFLDLNNIISDSTNGGDTSNTTGKVAVEADKGFIKKLFSSATKEEKAEKKEAKALQEIADNQVRVYGWYPYWMTNYTVDFKYNLLTTFSFYSIEILFDSITNQIKYTDHGLNNKSTKDIFNQASRAGCRIDVTIKCYNEKVIYQLLNNQVVQDSCIKYLVKKLNSNYLADGVCIVFENIPANNSASLLSFMSAVKMALSPSKRTLKLALPAKDYAHTYDILKLNSVVDSYILMGYNYHHKGSELGAVAPLDDKKKNLSIKASVKEYVDKGIPYKKLIVALPYYGIVWKKKQDGSNKYTYSQHWKYSQIVKNISEETPVIKFDTLACTHYYDFKMKSDSYRVFFDDDESLAKKYKWLIKQGVAGVGIWALGYDHGTQDFWKMIENNFTVVKMNPLKKEIVIKDSLVTDTSYFNFRIGSSYIRRQTIKDTIIRDTLFSKVINPDLDTASAKVEKSWISEELVKLKVKFEPLLANQQIAIAVLLALVVFGFLGIIGSLLFKSVRELLYIRSIPVYLFSNIALLLIGFCLFAFLKLFKEDIIDLMASSFYNQIYKWVWIILLSSWLLINLLSHKLIGNFSFKHEKP